MPSSPRAPDVHTAEAACDTSCEVENRSSNDTCLVISSPHGYSQQLAHHILILVQLYLKTLNVNSHQLYLLCNLRSLCSLGGLLSQVCLQAAVLNNRTHGLELYGMHHACMNK